MGVAPSIAGDLGRRVKDSGFRGSPVFAGVKLEKNNVVRVRGSSSPPQPIYGTYTVNCFKRGFIEVKHREGAWEGNGSFVHRVKLTGRAFDWCHVSPLIGVTDTEGTGKARVEVFVAPPRQ